MVFTDNPTSCTISERASVGIEMFRRNLQANGIFGSYGSDFGSSEFIVSYPDDHRCIKKLEFGEDLDNLQSSASSGIDRLLTLYEKGADLDKFFD